MEIEKEKRLPAGFRSWWQVAGGVPSQDFIQTFGFSSYPVFRSERLIPSETSSQFKEEFEIDSLTLKVRCFDEIKGLIPDEGTLQTIYSKVLASEHGQGFDESPLLKFISNLIHTLYPR